MSIGVEYRQAKRDSQRFELAAYAAVGSVAFCLVAIVSLGITILETQGSKPGQSQHLAAASQPASAVRANPGKR